jgi:hypothetical protein
MLVLLFLSKVLVWFLLLFDVGVYKKRKFKIPSKEWSLNPILPTIIAFLKGHPLKVSCQEIKLPHGKKSLFFRKERGRILIINYSHSAGDRCQEALVSQQPPGKKQCIRLTS